MISPRFGNKDLKLMEGALSDLQGRVLDIGCGDMVDQIEFIPGNEYIGVDIERTKYTSILGDIHKLPFKSESFDSCICNAVLEHVREPRTALSECNRVLKSGGVMWISVPFLQHIHANHDYRRFTGKELTYEVENAGFRVDWLHGNYGVVDNVEFLLFGALVWKINDALGASDGFTKFFKNYPKNIVWNISRSLVMKEGIVGIIYIFFIVVLLVIFKALGFIFDSQQKKDVHHPTSFDMIAHKIRNC